MADLFLDYVPPTGTPSHKLRTRQVGTDGGKPVIVEQLDEATFGVDVAAGQADVPTTEAALPSVAGRRVFLHALLSNGEAIAVGSTGVTMATGFLLLPGQTFPRPLTVANLNLLHVVAATAGQRVAWLVETV